MNHNSVSSRHPIHPHPAFDSPAWKALNQQSLMGAIAPIRHTLEHRLSQATDHPTPPSHIPEVVFPEGQCAALDTLCHLFHLSSFERNILLLCTGIELSKPIASLCAQMQGDPQHTHATFSLALALFANADWEVLTPKAPLRRWRLIEVGGGAALTTSPLRIDERILHYLLGIQQVDDRLQGIVTESKYSPSALASLATRLPQSYQTLVQSILHSGLSSSSSTPPVIQLCGPDSTTKEWIAAIACQHMGRSLHIIAADALPVELSQVNLLQCLCERETILAHTALLLDCDHLSDSGGGDNAIATLNGVINRLMAQVRCPVMMMSRDRRPQHQRSVITIDVQPPTPAEQQHLWLHSLAEAMGEEAIAPLKGHIAQLVANFNLSPAAIQTVTQRVQQHTQSQGQWQDPLQRQQAESPDQLHSLLWQTCLAQARPQLDDLAQPIRSRVDWEDLVLPEKEKAVLKTMHAHVKQRSAVYEDWGFAGKSRRGLGISALFAGASGTGKTLAAEVLANALHLDLYRIDLSAVVSKYIGETEKNLRRIFDVAETGGAVLLFDEADALFGKRSDVNDSHDRYANMEVAYLLQRIESYRGLAILTTNLKDSIDQAFLRRIRFVVQFPFPDAEQREEIWKRVFPPKTPTENLLYKKLAKLHVAGGNIRNIALNSAFLAADAGESVQMRHILHAAQSEYIKLERQLTDREVKGWVA